MRRRVVVVGGGAAGFFGAIACAAHAPNAEVTILEKGTQLLQKVKISGGGRCNVTHACFDPREFTQNYPRGERELIGPFHRFQAEDTVRWFESRGVKLKTEPDGRMFPVTDSSQTVIDCLLREAKAVGVQIRTNCAVNKSGRTADGFALDLSTGETMVCGRLLLAIGGCRAVSVGQMAISLGHTIQPPAPSLFTFHIDSAWVRQLAGVSVPTVEVSVADTKLKARGPLLFTHWGLSGPAILRLSAWGARILHEKDYNFALSINWLGGAPAETIRTRLHEHSKQDGAKRIANSPIQPISQRAWQALVELAGVSREERWSTLTRARQQQLAETLSATPLNVSGKSLNKDEFVTCGGVTLSEVNFKTMESKICPGLYFAGEVLDIDGITGGFNFQAAWTTGWIAGQSIAASLASGTLVP